LQAAHGTLLVGAGTAKASSYFPNMRNREEPEKILRRQLTSFANFTTRSLGETNIDSLMMDACLRARAGMNVTHAKLLEYLPARDRLLLRAGVGWKEGYVGQYEVAPNIDTPIGYAFSLSEPVPIFGKSALPSDDSQGTRLCREPQRPAAHRPRQLWGAGSG
jgi:hypothetical protein